MGPFTFSEKQCKGQLLFLRGVLWCGPDTPGVIPYSDVRVVNRVEGTRPGGGEGGVLSNLKRRRRAIEKSKKYCIVTLNTFTFIFVLSTLYCS